MTEIYNSQINFRIPNISFKSTSGVYLNQNLPHRNDNFATNPLYDNFSDAKKIEAAAKANPKIKEIMTSHNLPIKVNEKELEKLQHGHLQDTRVIAAKIYSSLPQELKNEVNMKNLQEAAMLHDYGKILIPDSILNKNAELTDKEWETMQLHSELGYELLKDKGLDKHTLELIKYHHQTPEGNGYPAINSAYTYEIDSQILNAADKYSALTEDRSYKSAMSREEALKIIEEDVKKGYISEDVYNAVKKATI